MRLEQKTIRVGEWVGDVPEDWDYDKFYNENLGQNKKLHDKAVKLFKQMDKALKQGKKVYATLSGGYKHEVYRCGLYDGWVFWKPRPCFSYAGAIPGEHREEYYNLRAIEVVDI